MTDDLVAFLRARLDEDEQTAREAAGAPWAVAEAAPWIHVSPDAIRDAKWKWGKLGYVATVEHDHDRAHIARHDPARVLRETEAKLRIVDMYAAALEERTTVRSRMREAVDEEFWRLHQHESNLIERARFLAPTVHALATVYADHPDYREEWPP